MGVRQRNMLAQWLASARANWANAGMQPRKSERERERERGREKAEGVRIEARLAGKRKARRVRTRARKRKGRKKKNKKEERQPGTRTEAPEAQERETMNLLATNRDEPTPSERVCVAEGERGRWLTNEEGERVEGRRENDTVRAESERERGGRTWGWFVELSYAAPLAKCAAPHERGYAVFAARKYRVFFFLSGKGSRSPNPSTRVKGLRGLLWNVSRCSMVEGLDEAGRGATRSRGVVIEPRVSRERERGSAFRGYYSRKCGNWKCAG